MACGIRLSVLETKADVTKRLQELVIREGPLPY
jgi:hypothetical protein